MDGWERQIIAPINALLEPAGIMTLCQNCMEKIVSSVDRGD